MAGMRFSSEAFPQRERASAIREGYASIAKVDIEPLSDEDFWFSGGTVVFPTAIVSGMTASPCKVIRRGEHTAYNSDLFVLGVATNGRLHAWQRGAEPVDCAPGETYLRGNDEPGGVAVLGDRPGILNIAIPHDQLAPAADDMDGRLRKVAPSAELDLLVQYGRTLLERQDDFSADSAALVSAHLRDLAVLALGGARDAQEAARGRGLRAVRLKAIKADIRANTGNPRFSLEWLAARHGISPRYLRALFYGEGTSFTDFVLEARLSHAYRLLTDPRFSDRNVSAIAFESGFGDLSWFYQAFRRRFGMTPRDLRESMRRNSGPRDHEREYRTRE